MDSTILNELREITKDTTSDNEKNFDGIYIFLSFDLANSTSFKNLNPNWPETIKLFRDYCVRCMDENFRHPEDVSDTNCCDLNWYSWKLLGDEIILNFTPQILNELVDIVHIIDISNNKLSNEIKNMFKEQGIPFNIIY